jgi:hypothetical protein
MLNLLRKMPRFNKRVPVKTRAVLLVLLPFLVGAACSLPFLGLDETGSESRVATAVAQTAAAEEGQEAGSTQPSADGQEGDDAPEDTAAPSPPTDTPSPEPTDTATVPPTSTYTPTPDAVGVHVTGNTYCRTGPGDIYESRGILNTDQDSELIAKDPTGSFWYIVNPDQPGENCWIWGNYATPEGPTDQLPVFTPPPSPTPYADFTAYFREKDACVAPWTEYTIENTGTLPLESFWIKVEDTDSGEVFGPKTSNVFKTLSGCLDDTQEDTIAPGGEAYLMSAEVGTRSYDPSGEPLRATIKICTQENLGGACLTRVVTFTSP